MMSNDFSDYFLLACIKICDIYLNKFKKSKKKHTKLEEKCAKE